MLFDGEDDPSCAFACANLLVSGDNIEPDEFTRLFGTDPTEVDKAGDCTGWRLSSESQVRSTNLERHIHWVLDQIEDKRAVIATLKEERNCQIDLGCWWKGHPGTDENGPFLTTETVQRIGTFDLNLIFYSMR